MVYLCSNCICLLAAICILLVGSAAAADYIFNGAFNLGTGYRDSELLGQTAAGQVGQKFAERIIGSGRSSDRSTFEMDLIRNVINFTQLADFEYFPVVEIGTYNRKWSNKICVINYDSGSALSEIYTDAELIHRSTEILTARNTSYGNIEAGIDSTFIGRGRIAWATSVRSDKRAIELSKSVDELTGAFSVKKYIDLDKRSGRPSRVDWLPAA